MNLIPVNLQKMMEQVMNEVDSDDTTCTVDPFTATTMLRDFNLNITCEFKVDDYVTPRPNGKIKGVGEPHRVIAVFETIQLHIVSVSRPLVCYNMVVAQVISEKQVNTYVAMSTDYELYTGFTVDEMERLDAGNM